MSKTKKVVVLMSMVLLLAVTAALNFVLTRTETLKGATITTSTFFTNMKTEKSANRNEEIAILDAVIASAEKGSTEYAEATEQKLAIVSAMESELLLENLIRAKGYEEVAVTMNLSGSSVSVMLGGDEPTKEDVAVIYHLVRTETGLTAENVKIMHV
ncbi:MAG: SpoIIIAH-like family protein [Clostridia bacterium]|nr:SpoIIIAH-like family protein [Clostridia bacterium]